MNGCQPANLRSKCESAMQHVRSAMSGGNSPLRQETELALTTEHAVCIQNRISRMTEQKTELPALAAKPACAACAVLTRQPPPACIGAANCMYVARIMLLSAQNVVEGYRDCLGHLALYRVQRRARAHLPSAAGCLEARGEVDRHCRRSAH